MRGLGWLMTGVAALAWAGSACGEVSVHGMFGDHAVLQRGIAVPVWGKAAAGEKVVVTIGGQTATTTAGADGSWRVNLEPMAAGGPLEMTVAGTNTIVLKDVVVGEVWIGSGQSNMQMTVGGSRDAGQEMAEATYPMIRQCSVAHRPMAEPTPEVSTSWTVCSPETVGGFTAVGYFFARDLHKALGVPVGIINSSWGGTPAEAWTPRDVMKAEGINAGMVEYYEQCVANQDEMMKKYQEDLAAYEKLKAGVKIRDRQEDPGDKGFEQGWAKVDFDDSGWERIELPRTWPESMDGAIWYRREVTLPEDWAGRDVQISLGSIDDYDVTYFNGERVGSTGNETANWWVHWRQYTIPGRLVKAGRNVVAVRVFDDLSGGGFTGMPEDMYVKAAGGAERISLAGPWRQQMELSLPAIQVSRPPSVPFGPKNPNAPGTLYNGMIYPLAPYAVRGAIWYQGESNVGRPGEYARLLSTMIREWRRLWGQEEFAFGIVQLANFLAVQRDANVSSGWAALRDAQLRVSQMDENVGLAVIIDIGEAADIHPKNKQDVGKRLGLWALATVYGRDVEYCGPIYRSMKVEDGKVRLSFDHVGGGLTARGDGPLKGFAICGEDGQFVWAEAKIEGETVVVWSEQVAKPTAVRYAWADNPVCNLYNEAGLPASPFWARE